MLSYLNHHWHPPRGIKHPNIIQESLERMDWLPHPQTPWIQYKAYPHAIYELNIYRDFLTVYSPRNIKGIRHICIQLKEETNHKLSSMDLDPSILNSLLTKREILTIARAAAASHEMFPGTLGRQIADLLLYNRTGENLFITAHEGKGSFPLLALLLECTPRQLTLMKNFDFYRLMKEKIATVKDFFTQLLACGLEVKNAPSTSQVSSYLPEKWLNMEHSLNSTQNVELPTLADLFMWFPEISTIEDDNESFVSIFIYRLEEW